MYSKPETLIIGCGNLLRGDDGAGPVLVRHLWEAGLPKGVHCADGGTGGMDVAFQMRPCGSTWRYPWVIVPVLNGPAIWTGANGVVVVPGLTISHSVPPLALTLKKTFPKLSEVIS